MNKYVVEFIGTFFLVLTVGFTVIEPGAGAMAPLAIGSALMVMVYAGGHISGGHYNPAVTLAVWMRGRCPLQDVIPYMAAQVIGGVIAAFIVLFLKGNPSIEPSQPNALYALIVEFLFTFALCYVVLNSATSKNTSGNSFYGLAIGFTVLVGAYAVGSISGAAFNPAVAAGVTVMGLSSIGNIWIFIVGNFVGGALAAVIFKFLNPEDK
jgi:aquaporin Z